MEFLRPAKGNKIFCHATPKKMGRSLAVIQVVLSDESEKVVATGTFSFYMSGTKYNTASSIKQEDNTTSMLT